MKFLLKSAVLFALVFSINVISTYQTKAAGPLGTELIFYDFEDNVGIGGTTTNQGSGGATYNGTYTGGASSTAAVVKFGTRSGTFSGAGDYVKMYYGTTTVPTTQSISISMWVWKKEASGCGGADDHLFGVSGPPVNTRFYLRCVNATSGWGMRFGGSAANNATTTTTNQSWQHLAMVFDATTDIATLYVNNVVRATSSVVSAFTLGDNFFVGNFNDRINNTFNEGSNAYIDNFGLYTSALSAGNVATLYNLGTTPGQPTGLTATPYENKVFLTWTSPGGTFDDYKVEYKLTSEPTTWTTFSDGVSTVASTTVTGLTNNLSYDFRVSSVNSGIEGTVSSTVTATPWYRIAFVSPTTVTAGATTSATFVTPYASTTIVTGATASTTHTLRIETAAGSLVSQISTTTRYGDRNLTHLSAVGESDLSLLDNSSGIEYVPTTDTVYIVHNRSTGTNSEIDEVTKAGVLVRQLTCTLCGDIEGITLISSTASSTAPGVFDNLFMISTENDLTNGEIFRVNIPSTGTAAVNRLDYFNPGISHSSNLGLEGIAYNSSSGVYYVAREKSTPALYEVTLGSGHSATASQICSNLDFSTIATDFSEVDYFNGVLYVLSHENNRLIPLDITSTSTCKYVDSDGDNGGVSSTSIDTGDFLNTLIAGSPNQPEGVTWDTTGDYLYVLGEADFLKRYRTTTFTIQNTFTGLTTGSYNLKSTFLDTNGVTANASPLSFGIDITGPVSSNIASTSATATGTVTWDTDEAGTSKVSYGTVSGTYTNSTSSAVLETSHTLTLTGLSAGTRYYFVVVSADTYGNYATSTENSVTTGAAADITAPSATLLLPENASTASSTQSLYATASDNIAVAGVKFYVDGVLVGSEDTTVAYTGSWDTTGYSEGSHTVVAVARDTSNNYGTSTAATVTVDNVAPVRSLGTPTGTLPVGTTSTNIGLTTGETATCKYSATAATAYGSMSSFTSTNNTIHSTSVSGLTNGTSYTYYVKCRDTAGNINATDYSITFSVANDTTAPSVTLTAPSNATAVSGASVSLTASASDDVAVAGVKFYVDGVLNGSEDTVSAYTGTWDSTTASEGTHTIVAVARDTSNNYATSSSAIVTVDNVAPGRSNGTPSGTLAYGTTGTTLGLITTEVATCKYSTSALTAYGSMTVFSSTDDTTHSTSITGLSNGTSYTYYVKCSDALSNINGTDYSISFSVSADITSPSATVTSPADGARVSGSSVSLAATASDDVSVAGVKFYVDGVLNGSEDTTSAYTGTWNSTLASEGSHTISAVARDTNNNYGTSSSVTVTVDNTTPPVRSSGSPSGSLSAGTTEALLSLSTNETATCKYSATAATSYGSMTAFSSTNSTNHSTTVTGLADSTSYTYYVKCSDTLANTNSDDYTISFAVAAPEEGGTRSGSSSSVVRRALAVLGLTTTPTISPTNPSVPGAPFVRPAAITALSRLSRPLYFGLGNEQVRTLQKVLNGSADTQVALTGPGSPGNETSLYLTKTQEAVKKFQLKYKIVTNVKDPGFGYVGPATRMKINELLYK